MVFGVSRSWHLCCSRSSRWSHGRPSSRPPSPSGRGGSSSIAEEQLRWPATWEVLPVAPISVCVQWMSFMMT